MSIKKPTTFIYLELLDPEVHAVLNGLKQVFGKSDVSSSIHITVRGPYDHPVKEEALDRFQMMLGHDPILIHGIDLFENSEFVVYIKINHNNLKKIWWKPDYPIEEHGFNPHITIYKGRDKLLARKIYTFMKKEELALLCPSYRLSTNISKQSKLFPEHDSSSSQTFKKLSRLERVRPDILERARTLIRNHNKSKDNQATHSTA